MAKKVAAIVTDLVEDVELTSPKEALEKAGHTVTLIGFEGNHTIKGKKGAEFTVEQSIADVSPEDFDALLIPGGFSPDQLRADQRFVDFVSYFL